MRRHVELIKGPYFWWEMIAGGSRTWRYLGHKDSAIKILSYLCEKKEKTVLAIQRQLIESGDLSKTNAGGELLHEISQRITAYEKSLNGFEGRMEKALEDKDQQQCADLAAVRNSYYAAIAARDGLTISLRDLYHQKGAKNAVTENLRKRETSQQGTGTGKQDIYDAQQYKEIVKREEMSDRDYQAAECESTHATGKGEGLLVNEARLMSEGLEQHRRDLESSSPHKVGLSQDVRSKALEHLIEMKQREEAFCTEAKAQPVEVEARARRWQTVAMAAAALAPLACVIM